MEWNEVIDRLQSMAEVAPDGAGQMLSRRDKQALNLAAGALKMNLVGVQQRLNFDDD